MEKKRIGIIGGGIGGLGAAALLAKEGYSVVLFEKNTELGGVCGRLSENGFTFDTGPSWYMMPEVYRGFFALLGEKIEKHFELKKLSPGYRVIGEGYHAMFDFECDLEKDRALYEVIESGSGEKVRQMFSLWKRRWELARVLFLEKNYDSVFSFLNLRSAKALPELGLFQSAECEIAKQFHAPLLRALFSFFPSFLGGSPRKTPALFNFLNSSAHEGIYYPIGGMYEIVRALVRIGEKYGAEYKTETPVAAIETKNDKASGVRLADGTVYECDLIVSGVDVTYTEKLLGNSPKKPSPSYSALLVYLGIEGKIPELKHHTIYFPKNWERHFADIEAGVMPENPALYISATSKTDPFVAPPDHENLFVLVPIPPREYREGELEQYSDLVLRYLEEKVAISNFQKRIVHKKIFGGADFSATYNTYGNSALGPAQTLFQSGPWRQNNVHRKIQNLYFVGSSTNPGIGIPPVLLSAKRAWKRIKANSKP